ncbi:MAG: 2-dehydro-3-deoxygalactonokinase [Betaproteobacteria bacterium]
MTPAQPTALLALDWGTTSARAYRLDAAGRILDQRSAPLGIAHVGNGAFAAALDTLLGDWRQLRVPRLACGMIGSRQGWIEAPYSACPAALSVLAKAIVHTPASELGIVGGLTCRDDGGVPDVMRGEETQVAGLLDAAHDTALIVQPGTHGKWTVVIEGAIVAFKSYMTGEVFAMLREHSILGRMMQGDPPFESESFERGVRSGIDAAAGGELLHQIFGARTLALFGELPPEGTADYLSGVLIGSEVAAGCAWAGAKKAALPAPWLLGAPALCNRYRIAFGIAGHSAKLWPPDVAARGLWRIAAQAGLVADKDMK